MNASDIQRRLREFAEARDWNQFHSPKNLAMALAAETGELLEVFQWLTPEESQSLSERPRELSAAAAELADVCIYALRLADVLGLDLGEAIWRKISENERRYPPEQSLGRAKRPGGHNS